jgi:hypothetical protein
VEVCPWNLLQYSEDFTNGVWTQGNVSITSNATTAPNGTTTADKIIPNTSNAAHGIENSGYLELVIGSTCTTSFYAKASGYNFIQWLADGGDVSGNPRANFNLSNGTLGSVDTGLTASIESVGNGWYRCIVSFVVAYNTFNNGFYISDSATASRPPVFAGNGTDGVFVWGAQLNIGSTAKPYFPTTDRLNVPRLTYQNGGGGCPSLLLEKQSTNIVTYSEQINSTNYSLNNVTSSENILTSPDGTINADKIIENTSNSSHSVNRFVALGGTVDNSAYSVSVFAKAEGRSQILFYDNNQNVGGITYFNLSTGVVTSGTGKIENFGNGWYRCTIFCLKDNSTNANLQFYLLDSSGNSTYTGNGTSGMGLWGFQLEASSYPTSYIPTTSASATRVADACFKTGISSLIGQTEGVIFCDFVSQPTSTSQSHFWIKGTSGNEIGLYGNSQFIFYSSGGVSINGGNIVAGTRYKVAFAYKANDYVAYINSTQVGTDTSATVPTTSALYINSYSDFTEIQNKQVNEFVLFPTRLTNAELAALTTI